MPIKKKISKAESNGALELQAPVKAKDSKIKPIKLRDAHLDANSRSYVKSADLFEQSEYDDVSLPFFIHNATRMPSRLREGSFQINFTIRPASEFQLDDERSFYPTDEYILSLPDDENRAKFVKYFLTETQPFGPVALVKLPVSTKGHNPYLSIQDFDEIPF